MLFNIDGSKPGNLPNIEGSKPGTLANADGSKPGTLPNIEASKPGMLMPPRIASSHDGMLSCACVLACRERQHRLHQRQITLGARHQPLGRFALLAGAAEHARPLLESFVPRRRGVRRRAGLARQVRPGGPILVLQRLPVLRPVLTTFRVAHRHLRQTPKSYHARMLHRKKRRRITPDQQIVDRQLDGVRFG
jgi:hypothetical protein